jgi:cell wall-associated NlpC family hydrolase
MVDRAAFVAEVLRLVGTPVVHMGRVGGQGVDCGGAILAPLWALGSSIVCEDVYPPLPDAAVLEGILARFCDRLPVGDVRPGDVLQTYVGRQARHAMIVVGRNATDALVVVHAWGKGGRVSRAPIGPETRIACAWRIKELDG